MNKKTKLALSVLTFLLAAAPALAQSTMPAKPGAAMEKMQPGAMMKAAPTFHFSTDRKMNMMMTAGAVDITAAPGEKLITRSMTGQSATLVFAGMNSHAIFDYYDKAIKAEGWKTTAMDGKMMSGDAMMGGDKMATKPGDTMAAKPADTMATKPGDTMAAGSAMMSGTHSATFALGGHTIDLLVRESGGRVTVVFKSK